MSVLDQLAAVLKKDFVLEWRRRTRLLSIVLFGVVTLLLFSFALDGESDALNRAAAGFLVLALLLSSTLGLSESFRIEHENQALEGLLLLPVEPVAFFYGKAIGNALFLLLLAPILMPVALVLYAVEIGANELLQLLALWAAVAAGLAAPGTLYAAMTSRLRSQDVLLPLLLYPLEVPLLLAAVKSFDLVLRGDPMDQLDSWTLFLIAFDVIYWSLCGLLSSFVLEEGT